MRLVIIVSAFTFLWLKAFPQGTKVENLVMRFNIVTKEPSKKVTLTCLIPQSICNRQEIISIDYSIKPARIFTANTNAYAEFVIDNPPPNLEVVVFIKAKLFQYDFEQVKKNNSDTCKYDTALLSQYLINEKYIE